MIDESRIRDLAAAALESNRTPEEVCREHPELVEAVAARCERLRKVVAEIESIFPEHPVDPDEPTLAALPSIPGHEVLSVLGRGGMGVVFKARHLKLNRVVAIKMLLAGQHASATELTRFRLEAEAVASLSHPNIVQIHDVGELDGKPYFTMEFVDGGTLAAQLRGVPLAATDAAARLATLTEAVAVAHRGGIVHRDLKPGNVLLCADGTPKITDFGLARQSRAASSLTASGAALGTPSYMAPEQVRGARRDIGPAVDIYALGAILYEMLTGSPPFVASSPLATQMLVLTEDPVPPSRLNSRVPRDLETVCLKCLQKVPQARYATARDLGDDLGRFLRHEPIHARPVGRFERAARWVRRNPSSAALLGVLVALLGLAIGYVLREWTLASGRHADKARLTARLESGIQLQRQGHLVEARALLGRLGDGGFEDLRGPIDRAVADLDLAETLDDIRLDRATIAGGLLDSKTADRDYQQAFAACGLDLDKLSPLVVAKRITDSPIRGSLVAALDDWSISASQPTARNQILEVARVADPDPWRDQLRDPANWADAAALARLAECADVSAQPVSILVALGSRLSAAGGDARSFCKRVEREYPGDFWSNYQLGRVLDRHQDPEAITYFVAALASRPNTLAVYLNLSPICQFHGRDAEAIDFGQRAVRLAPDSVIAHVSLAGIYMNCDDRMEDTVAECQTAIQIDPNYPLAYVALGAARLKQGQFAEAAAVFERCAELMPPGSASAEGASSSAATCRRLMDVEASVPAALAGIEEPDQPDLCEVAMVCFLKKRYADAATLYRRAIAADPRIVADPGDEVRLTAACAAVRAVHEKQVTTNAATDDASAEFIDDALAWLNADLSAWSEILETNQEPRRVSLIENLNRWKARSNLTAIRDAELLQFLSPEQQAKCRSLWAEVSRLLHDAFAAGE